LRESIPKPIKWRLFMERPCRGDEPPNFSCSKPNPN
jgi:hypothetical protein